MSRPSSRYLGSYTNDFRSSLSRWLQSSAQLKSYKILTDVTMISYNDPPGQPRQRNFLTLTSSARFGLVL